MQKNVLTIIGIFCFVSGCHINYQIGKPDIDIAEKFWGTWESSGYGYAVKISTNQIEVYDVTDNYCKKQEISSEDTQTYFANFEFYNNNKIGFSLSKVSKIYELNRIPALPQNCQLQIANNPKEAFRYFVDVMSEHYAFFDLYDVDWDSRVKQVSPQVSNNMTNQELADVFKFLIKDINDGHLFIRADIDGESETISNDDSRILTPALDKAFSQQTKIKTRRDFGLKWYMSTLGKIAEELLTDATVAANDQIIWGKIGNIGYINILNMHGFSDSGLIQDELNVVDTAFKKIMSELNSSSSIIIDVTTNSGGSDEIGRLITGYFTQNRKLMYSHLALGSSEEPQKYYTNPSKNHVYLGPVYIFTSDHTVSAAETFTMAMKALPTVTHVGTTTRGAFSDILDKTLPNGWEVGLSNMYYWDANGDLWESKGLTPDIDIPVFSGDDIYTSHLQATQKLTKIINTN